MQPSGQWTVAKIVASWKSYTARRISAWRRSNGAEPAEPLNARRPGQVWHREYWDRYMRDEQHLQDTLSYIHANPVKARLVDSAEDWPWSSAARHAGLKEDDANTAT
jgi:type I restriction enzyme R subunit/putative DNA methylase